MQDVYQLMETYVQATEVGCELLSATGQSLRAVFPAGQLGGFCQLIRQYDVGVRDCEQAHKVGGRQADMLGETFVFFCPYGLVHWAVPLTTPGGSCCYLLAGPVLLHPVDDLLVADVMERNPSLADRIHQVHACLAQVGVVSPQRVHHLGQLLMVLTQRNGEGNRSIERQREIQRGYQRTKSELLHSFEQEKNLISRIRVGDQHGAREVLNEMLGFVFFHGSRFEAVKTKAIEVMVVLARAAIEVGADLEALFGREYAYLENVDQVSDIDELSTWLIGVLDRFMEGAFALHSAKNRDLLFGAMEYIRRNCHRDVSLTDVAAQVGLAPSYFSRLFKEEANVSFSEYLNRVRIESSKRHLLLGCSLVDASQLSGFSDQSYFSRVFKRLEGMSPGKWRQKMRYQAVLLGDVERST